MELKNNNLCITITLEQASKSRCIKSMLDNFNNNINNDDNKIVFDTIYEISDIKLFFSEIVPSEPLEIVKFMKMIDYFEYEGPYSITIRDQLIKSIHQYSLTILGNLYDDDIFNI